MRERKGLNSVIIVSTFTIFALSLFLTLFYMNNYSSNNNLFFSKYNKKVNNELRTILNNQKEMDQKIADIQKNGGYTMDEPCIINNPYGISPLSSVAIFNTEKEVSVKIYINDIFITETKKTKKHIVPIYGLYSHTNNIVKLVASDNKTYETIIKTDSYNFNIGTIEYEKILDNNDHFFLLGNLNDSKSNLRGFDKKANLIFYLDLDYVNSFAIKDNHLLIGYNSKLSSSNLDNLKLEIDYLGKIYAISTNTNNLKNIPNVFQDNEKYIAFANNIYPKQINNLEPITFIDSAPASEYIEIYTSDIENAIIDAEVYNENYDLAINGDYLTFDFKNINNASLAIIGKDSTITYLYNIDDTNTIKLNREGEYSLYLKVNSTYYNLLTTINN